MCPYEKQFNVGPAKSCHKFVQVSHRILAKIIWLNPAKPRGYLIDLICRQRNFEDKSGHNSIDQRGIILATSLILGWTGVLFRINGLVYSLLALYV